MTTPFSFANVVMGTAEPPAVLCPSVNMTMTLAFDDIGSNSPAAVAKASAWLVDPPAVSAFTAAFRSATEVISCVSAVALSAKLTMAIRLPDPIVPSCVLSVASSMMSIKVSAPDFIFASGLPAMLPERSSTRTISTGLLVISGAAASERIIWKRPSQATVLWRRALSYIALL